MGMLESAWRFLRWQDTPQPHMEVRESFGNRPIAYTLNKPQWSKRNVNTYVTEGYTKLALVFRCIGVLGQAVANAPLRVAQETPDGMEYVETHALRQLLRHPNRQSNEARLMGQVIMTMAVAGFCVIEKERSAAGRVVGLWPINPAYCKPIPRSDALPAWEVKVPGYEPVILNSTDVIAITYADRVDQDPTGIGPLEIVLREIDLLNIQTDFLKAFFDQGAMPVYGLVFNENVAMEDMTQAKADAIREAWRSRYGGMRSSVEPAVLAGVKDIKRLSFDFDELAFTDLRDMSDIAICQVFGIPPILVGTHYGVEHATYSNYGQARTSFYEDTVSPLWNRIEDAFARALIPEFERRPGYSLEFDTSDVPALREDIMPRRTWAVSALQAGGISTHQFARECGLQPIGADVFLRSIATVEIPSGTPKMGARATIPALLEDRAFTAYERRSQSAQAGRRAYLRIAERHEPKIRRFLNEQGQRITELATRERRDLTAIDWTDEEQLLRKLIESLHTEAGQTAYELVAETLNIDSIAWDVVNPNITKLTTTLGERIVDISETTRLDVSKIVTDSLTEGVSMDELAGRIGHLFEETYPGRAMTIARTESQVAYNEAAALGYLESGIVRQAQLFDNPLHDTDPGSDGLTCAQRNGKIVPLETISRHIQAEHVNGTLAIGAVIDVENFGA